jgi:hypothetical protein
MTTNDQTYTNLMALRDRLEVEQTRLQREFEAVAKKLEHVSATLALLDAEDETPVGRVIHGVPTAGVIDIQSLQNLTQLQALRKIALQGDGTFATTTAKQLLLKSGLIKNPKNANNILFSVINRSGLFERVTPGVYRLKSDKPTRPEKTGGSSTLVF